MLKKIKKNVIKLNNAIGILNKYIPEDTRVSAPFDLAAQVEYDSGVEAGKKRVERNKRKAVRKAQK